MYAYFDLADQEAQIILKWYRKQAYILIPVNYSSSARNFGLIIHAEITFGYEVHWQTVHEVLIKAAKKTGGIQETPEPFVLEISMKDFYIVYQINAYIKEAEKQPKIYSDLYQNIQDLANEAEIEMLSPHFIATRDASEIFIPKEKFRKGKD